MTPPSTQLKYTYLGLDKSALRDSLTSRLIYTVGKDNYTATRRDWLVSLIYSVRDRLVERWMETMRSYYKTDTKRVYYMSLEFLMGRTLENAMLNLEIMQAAKDALAEIGVDWEQVLELEEDAGLGNGGLGRLAACFLDSFATLRLPCYGYGIRYEYGMFKQTLENGNQSEHPDNWLRYGNAWEIPRAEVLYPVHFGGRVVQYQHPDRGLRHEWVETDAIMAMAHDTPIPGYNTNTVNNLRLWAARASRDFDLHSFNRGDYIASVAEKSDSENLSKVLYPSDATATGRRLRLKQQYFFVSASLQDILYRFRKSHPDLRALQEKVAIQLNDTHPAIAIAELMRVFVDENHMPWTDAWKITTKVFAYTNHTLMPEALETWPVQLFEELLPRHLQIIYEINHRFLDEVRHRYPGNTHIVNELSIIGEHPEKHIRMAHLAIVGSHKVNGVAKLHTDLLKQFLFRQFHEFYPEKFINITNGVTPRRWLYHCNPNLSSLIKSKIGAGWLTYLDELKKLEPFVADEDFRREFSRAKEKNKTKLCEYVKRTLNIELNPQSLFDVQIKRIHEYKRQLLNALHVVTRYNRIRQNPTAMHVPRTVIISGKAAPGYWIAKLIIKLINDIADVVNNDPAIGDRLKVVFIPNYNVTMAELIIPAADLSQQISTAGTEASGTGNMKLALNGAMTIGTLDGANIEIRDAVGDENMFIFGLRTAEVQALTPNYQPRKIYETSHELKTAVDMIENGFFSPEQPSLFKPIVDSLLNHDQYLLLADYASYVETQYKVDELYVRPSEWTTKAILNVARMGFFSSDRCIHEYASRIWNVNAVERE